MTTEVKFEELLDLLEQFYPVDLNARDIAQMLNKKEGNVRKLLSLMVRDKQIIRNVTKPVDVEQFTTAIKSIGEFWTGVAKLPSKS